MITARCRPRPASGADVRSTLTLAFAGALAVLASPPCTGLARADEPVAPGEPRLMSETAEVTSVVDAFDEDDPFDLNLMIGFQQTWKHANIRRETTSTSRGSRRGASSPRPRTSPRTASQVSTLDIGADIGIYRDLALIFRLPLILVRHARSGDLDGSADEPAAPGRPGRARSSSRSRSTARPAAASTTSASGSTGPSSTSSAT